MSLALSVPCPTRCSRSPTGDPSLTQRPGALAGRRLDEVEPEPVAPSKGDNWRPYAAEPSESTLAALEHIEDPELRRAIATARVALSKR